ESIRALHTAIDAGVTLIDTAPTYGTGHSERVIGQALAGLPVTVRESVAVATKFGLRIDESRRVGGGNDVRLRQFVPSVRLAWAGSAWSGGTFFRCRGGR